MFITFYSYKGGVGRSLALANIACLMAQDEEHPQRVLIWDFDLEAPGLHRLFPPKQPQTYGFVDLAYEYARSGNIPNVDDYIYESEIDGISVLPAGKIGESYCEKLQQIDWLKFFGKDRTSAGPFFSKIVESINERSNPFDYVLVDSRTGLNDQAGICTQVLSDLIAILFRLNAQNLDGLEHLAPAIKSQLKARNKENVRILPIASQVGVGSSRDLFEYREKATRIFGKDLEYIRFDEGLIGGERLFCQLKEMASMWPVPPVVGDYRRICSIIREQNENDTRTAVKQLINKMNVVDSATAARMLLRLLPKRPRLHKLWTYLETLFDERMSKSMRTDFEKIVSRILRADKTNYFAYEWKAAFQSSKANNPEDLALNKAKKLLLKAIEYAPSTEGGYIYRALARIESCQGNHQSAVKALRKAQDLQPDNNQISLDLATLYMRMGEKYFAMAAEELDRVSLDIGDEKYAALTYLRTFLGESKKASEALESCKEMKPLVQAHMLLIKGNKKQATDLATREPSDKRNALGLANLVEFYLCSGNFDKAVSMFEENSLSKDSDIVYLRCISYLAEFLRNKNPDFSNQMDAVIKEWRQIRWNFRELLMFREGTKASGVAYEERVGIIEKLIQFQELREIGLSTGGLISKQGGRKRPRFTLKVAFD